MITTLRKSFLLVVMALVLLAGLFGWTMKMGAAPPFPQYQSGIHAGHTVALLKHPYCPPPPYQCS